MIIGVVEKSVNAHELEDICQKEGHSYGEWNKRSWTDGFYELGDTPYDNIYYKEVLYREWYRICSRCGNIERIYVDPKKLVDGVIDEEAKRLKYEVISRR